MSGAEAAKPRHGAVAVFTEDSRDECLVRLTWLVATGQSLTPRPGRLVTIRGGAKGDERLAKTALQQRSWEFGLSL